MTPARDWARAPGFPLSSPIRRGAANRARTSLRYSTLRNHVVSLSQRLDRLVPHGVKVPVAHEIDRHLAAAAKRFERPLSHHGVVRSRRRCLPPGTSPCSPRGGTETPRTPANLSSPFAAMPAWNASICTSPSRVCPVPGKHVTQIVANHHLRCSVLFARQREAVLTVKLHDLAAQRSQRKLLERTIPLPLRRQRIFHQAREVAERPRISPSPSMRSESLVNGIPVAVM